MQEFNVDSKAECGQFNLAHLTKNKKNIYKKEGTKTNKRQCPLSSVQVRKGSPGNQKDYGGKDL